MELRLNKEKTHLVKSRENPLIFWDLPLVMTRAFLGEAIWHIYPSKKSCKKFRRKLDETLKQIGHYSPDALVGELNPMIRGWINYSRSAKSVILRCSSENWISISESDCIGIIKGKVSGSRLYGREAYEILIRKYGLIKPYGPSLYKPLNALTRTPRKPYAGKPHVRFDEELALKPVLYSTVDFRTFKTVSLSFYLISRFALASLSKINDIPLSLCAN
ncbi:MAG: group II intron maturase-specific domain-containing protein [Bacteroidia bacterium]